ncbi:hypothetical protein BKP42_53400 [Rhodococcus erythropolis]|nr:hypothetical protein BKP42_53400 [Rhodococcus erythropolis]
MALSEASQLIRTRKSLVYDSVPPNRPAPVGFKQPDELILETVVERFAVTAQEVVNRALILKHAKSSFQGVKTFGVR